jgi:uncharacterized protein (DUF1810 family)
MHDMYDLGRFVQAQKAVYERVIIELAAGRKQSHWMWFIFPQLRGLGSSATARRFGITSVEEARAYLDHPLLGARLRECTRLTNSIRGRSVEQIFGYPDDLKLRSCMTLFRHAALAGSPPTRSSSPPRSPSTSRVKRTPSPMSCCPDQPVLRHTRADAAAGNVQSFLNFSKNWSV